MFSGNAYFFDNKPLIDDCLNKAILKYNLSYLPNPNGHEYIYQNQYCTLKIFVADIRDYKWTFYPANMPNHFEYAPNIFIKVYHKIERQKIVYRQPIDSFEEFAKQSFLYFNDEILQYLEAPMQGDFSWHNDYKARKEKLDRYRTFAHSTTYDHSEQRLQLARMFNRKTDGWEEAMDNYFNQNDESMDGLIIHNLLQSFAAILSQSAEESRQDIQLDLSNDRYDLDKAIKEIRQALKEPDFDWLNAAQSADFIFLTPHHNQQAVKIDFIVHILDLFFPEISLSAKELENLKVEVVELLTLHAQSDTIWVAVDELALQVSSKQYDIPGAIIFQLIQMRNQVAKDELAIKLDPTKGYCLALKSSTEEEVPG